MDLLITLLFIGLVLSVVVNVVLLYAAWNSIRKIEAFEERYVNTKLMLDRLLNNMRQIDEKEMFEKDDEVGVIFDQLQTIISFYNKLI